MARPKVNSAGQQELDRAQENFDKFDQEVKGMTLDQMNKSPVPETEPQTKISTKEARKADALYIKPVRSINSKEPRNDKYKEDHAKAWEYVRCIVENNEIIGESIEIWTKKFAGDPAHFWLVPTNKPIYIPRLLAERISGCKYHRLMMDQKQMTGADGMGTYMGSMVVDHTKQRLDCRPVGFEFVSMAG